MEHILETVRLRLRRFTEDDVDALTELDSDPEVMRYLTGGAPTPRELIRDEIIPRILGYYDRWPHYGTFAAQERVGGGFIGWFAMRPRAGDPDDRPELGYRLRRAAWGQGYATEGSRALIDKAFGEWGAGRVIAETMAVNLGSRHVMEKCGLRHVGTRHEVFDDPIPGTEEGEVDYALDRADWLARRTG